MGAERSFLRHGAAVTCIVACFLPKAFSCGISWELPQNHFDGVNEQGHLSYWEKIGEIDLGNDLKLPLNINFRSDRETSSPELGKGWFLALLDSNIVQYDETTFILNRPDGIYLQFWRDKDNPDLLNGQEGWKAQIRDNTITAWASCGWKMVFIDGRISSITTPDNHQLAYNYTNGKVSSLTKDGSPVLTVETDLATGIVNGITYQGKKIGISEDQRPLIQTVEGQNLVASIAQSLNKLSLPDGSTQTFDFSVTNKIQPVLKISGASIPSRTFTWNPSDKTLSTDGDWTYHVKQGPTPLSNAEISRQGPSSQKEYWFYDVVDGQEITQLVDGTKKIRSWFTSGILAGKSRSTKIFDEKGNLLSQEIFRYDETGDLIAYSNDKESYIIHKIDATTSEALDDKKQVLWKATYDNDHRLLRKEYASGKIEENKYDDSGKVTEMFTNPNGLKTVFTMNNNKITSYKIYDSANAIIESIR